MYERKYETMNETSAFGGGWIAVIALIVVLMFGGSFAGGGRQDVSTIVNDAINAQSTQTGIRDVLLSSANNNYETAQLINSQTLAMMAQNNTNQISVLEGYNAMTLANANAFAELRQQMAALGFQMQSCCCDIKTQMLQYRLDDAERRNVVLDGQISNYNQTQTLLGTMGKWVANPASAAAAA